MENLEELQNSLLHRVAAAGDLEALESLRVQALGKKGEVTQRLKTLASLSPDARKEAGQSLNRVKDAVAEAIEARRADLQESALEARLAGEAVDVTLPARPAEIGRIHGVAAGGERGGRERLGVRARGKKGEVTQRLKTLASLSPDARKEAGQSLNRVKDAVAEAIEARRADLQESALEARLAGEAVDVTLPARPAEIGRIH